MTRAPIIDDVRSLRDEMAKEHDYDIDDIFDALRKMEAASGREHVSLAPRRTTQPAEAADGRKHGVPMKRISYRGGLVEFSLPEGWCEEFYPEGGAAFFQEGRDETLNLTVTTVSVADGVDPGEFHDDLARRFAGGGAVVEQLPNGNLLVRGDGAEPAHSPPLHITFWSLFNLLPPDTVRYAVFGYAVAADTIASEAHIVTVRMLDEQISTAVFTSLRPDPIDRNNGQTQKPWWRFWR